MSEEITSEVMDKRITSLAVSWSVWKELNSMKTHPRDTSNDVIKRLLKEVKELRKE